MSRNLLTWAPDPEERMTCRERVWAALRGEPVDRPPVSFWGHFYDRESNAEDLVEATLEFQRDYDWDWVKLNPRKHYHAEPWGVSYRYSGSAQERHKLTHWPIHRPEDWRTVTERPHTGGALAEQITAVRLLRRELADDVPLVQTVFTPLAILGEMVEGPAVLESHLRSHPDLVRKALEGVTVTFERYVREILAAGADGIFLATVDWGSRDVLSPEDYRSWARPYDARILQTASAARFNVLHVCKRKNLLFELADYPVSAFSWAATDPSNPSLGDALTRLKGAVMGGISQDNALQQPSPDPALAEFRRALEQTGGRRWLVAPGCSIPPTTPPGNLRAIRAAVEDVRLSPQGTM